eukprot:16065-Eustigmatos_ZCMA.PRE.1
MEGRGEVCKEEEDVRCRRGRFGAQRCESVASTGYCLSDPIPSRADAVKADTQADPNSPLVNSARAPTSLPCL